MSPETGGDENLQQRIRNAKQELEHMIDLHPQGMFLADREGMVVRANAGLLSLLGAGSFSELLGRNADDLFPPPAGERRKSFRERLSTPGASSSASFSWETEIALVGRGRVSLRFTAVPSRGRPDRCMVLVDDLSEERAAARRKEKKDKTHAAEALMGALHHVLNQPLSVIMGRAQLLLFSIEKGSTDPAEIRSTLEEIIGLSRRIADTLARARKLKDFVTENYLGDVDILNLERSSGNEEDDNAEDPGTH